MKAAGIPAMVVALFLAMSSSVLPGVSFADDIYVDNTVGDDPTGDGSQANPYRTLSKGVNVLGTSDTLHLTNTGVDYYSNITINKTGTPANPTVIDGHGATLSALTTYSTGWTDMGGGVYSRLLHNNAWAMQSGYWEGNYDLVFFNGAAGTNCTSVAALVDNGYCMYLAPYSDPDDDTLYVKLPAGQTPASMDIQAPGTYGVNLWGANIVIKNVISEYAGIDGFGIRGPYGDTTGAGAGIVLDNVTARYNMDQGISNHGSEIVVTNSTFENNAGCGIVDVYDSAVSTYTNCLIRNNSPRGGVEFYAGVFELVDCTLVGNESYTFRAGGGATVTFRNCDFTTSGSIVVSGASHTTFHGDLVNSGTFSVNAGSTAVFMGDLTSDGITGPGTKYIGGRLRPAHSPGEMTFEGEVYFADTLTMEMEIGGVVSGTEYDVLNVDGLLDLDGELQVTLIDGFEPRSGDRFLLVDCLQIVGEFDSMVLPDLSAGLTWDYEQEEAGLSLTVRLTGDATCDGVVNSSDYMALKRHMGLSAGAAFSDGDFDGDGDVDWDDLQMLIGSYDAINAGSGTTPEPATLTLLALGGLALLRRRCAAWQSV